VSTGDARAPEVGRRRGRSDEAYVLIRRAAFGSDIPSIIPSVIPCGMVSSMATNAKGMAMPTMTEQSEKVRENRLRAMAERQGLKISKSRQRDPRGLSYGRWMIVDPFTKSVVTGTQHTGSPNMSLDEVEAYLTSERGER